MQTAHHEPAPGPLSDAATGCCPAPTRRALLAGAASMAAAVIAEPARAAPTRRRVMVATVSANYREGLEAVAREYERLHPGVDVVIQIMPATGYETWLRTQISSGGDRAPDLFNANYAWGMYERGLMVNLSPHIQRTNPYTGKPWIETLSRQFIEKFKVGGDVSFIPLDFIEIGFYYNARLFRKHGCRPPRTWEEMLEQAQRLRAAGVLPFAIPGNADSYWSGAVGWMARFLSDAYTRHYVPLVLSRPGDWDYDARRNAGFRLNLADPYNDANVVTNGERLLAAVRDRAIRADDGRFAELYTRLKEFSRHWQRGFHGASTQTAYTLFLTQRAAVLLETSSALGQIMRDMDDLPERARFEWGVFPVPRMVRSAFRIPPFRGVGGPGTSLGVVRKDREQERWAIDFLMFLTRPASARSLVDHAVRHRRPLVGPMLVPGAPLPERVRALFAPFEGRGFERLSFRGLMDDQQSVWEWTVWAQRYMEDQVPLRTFLARYQRLMLDAVPRVVALQGLDMDPRTRDRKVA
ncbi:MAG TPA: extracellular solute-binding protein [Chthonomonadales bacterium]|nr:extracellular solute-binding protein [Chthonomonadales bacterium]